jgi:hypothetical protein
MPVDTGVLATQFRVVQSSSGSLKLSFNIDRIDFVNTPAPRNIFNQFDELGLIIGLPRLTGEKNIDYKRRLFDVYRHKASSTYTGLINGITREFGSEMAKSVVIRARRDLGGSTIGANPVIELSGPQVLIWKDKRVDTTPYKIIDRFNMTIWDLIVQIDNTPYFSAALYNGDINKFDRAMTLINVSSLRTQFFESIPSTTRFYLKNSNVLNNSWFWTDDLAFKTKVASAELVLSEGQYYLDKTTGLVTTFTSPEPASSVRYQYITDPLEVFASPIILHNIQSESFKKVMFDQILQDDGTYTHGMLTQLGADLVNELISVYPMYYGE